MGLGKALCDQLLAEGWQVLSVDRHADRPAANLEHLTCDLSDADEVDKLPDWLLSYGPFDLVILNAGSNATGNFETLPLKVQERLVRLNAETPMVLASMLASNAMMARPSTLVFVSSLSHFTYYPGAATYSATKSAIAIHAKGLRKPFAKIGIAVSCVFPGPLDTAHAERHAPQSARNNQRMKPQTAARIILAGVKSGRRSIFPGLSSWVIAAIGKIAPAPTARVMRQIIYKKLNRDVW
jgi:short-subunit dehydrogenase